MYIIRELNSFHPELRSKRTDKMFIVSLGNLVVFPSDKFYNAARTPARARGRANPPTVRALAAPVKVGMVVIVGTVEFAA